jgi:hypothetical protein
MSLSLAMKKRERMAHVCCVTAHRHFARRKFLTHTSLRVSKKIEENSCNCFFQKASSTRRERESNKENVAEKKKTTTKIDDDDKREDRRRRERIVGGERRRERVREREKEVRVSFFFYLLLRSFFHFIHKWRDFLLRASARAARDRR